ncbi:DegT/DnrJ/EryC1/StrS family aminotransferase [Variovorax guangxiensis]|uniref:DegT/DnrJ/EryC1/StrS family aminotransferase n=1 Tax=Variovorax guangxiensis TaxID=1775474 RepID=A0A502DTP9_9BURK|nr:DegT/DnrJ/EryC1/StrS family aminotransferase [Variovorax guangxiensis]TPG24548.1 DegT/DnrJ/EryC1/StrS family aminotransferase [Variovorax ginsengisoli]TPG28798.1 DegT/DnrJ/EryC1/StrS family aminotransferase [Variovorax guangxiensis]
MNIPVTKPFLPDFAEYALQLKGIWQREWLTNNGPLVNELELSLKQQLGLEHLLFVTNGTVALQIAIVALGLDGDIITTPFSYVATTSSIVWEKCKPVMVDVCPGSFNIDPEKIEAAITRDTKAILATHVFGVPCDVDAIEEIAKKHDLPVIYDAAHAFGSTYNGRSVLSYGDIATCSFHATKLFHTVEGGSVSTPRPELLRRMAQLRNFGHVNATEFDVPGINGKNSEFHAAMGLCNLPHVHGIVAQRQKLYARYKENLADSDGDFQFQEVPARTEYNCAYFPVVFMSEQVLLKITETLNLHNVAPRRYFYPALSKLPYISGQDMPVAESIAQRILCLPMYNSLSIEEVDMICRLIKRVVKYG